MSHRALVRLGMGCRGAFRAALLLALAVALGAAPAIAQDSPPAGAEAAAPPEPPAEPEVVPAAEVASRAATLASSLRTIRARAEKEAAVARIEPELEELSRRNREQSGKMIQRLEQEASIAAVGDAERIWGERARQMDAWNATLARRAELLARDLRSLDEQRELWERTGERAREDNLPQPVREQIRASVASIAETRAVVKKRRDAILTLQAQLVEEGSHVTAVLDTAKEVQGRLRVGLLVRDSAPLWVAVDEADSEGVWARIRTALETDWSDAGAYLAESGSDLWGVGAVVLALVVALVMLRRRAERRVREEPEFEGTARVLARPLSGALLILLLSYPWLLPSAPRLVRSGFTLIVVIPVLRLLVPLVPAALRRPLQVLTAWYLVDWVRILVEMAPLVDRLMLLAESLAVALALAWALRPARLAVLAGVGASEVESAWLRGLAVAARVSLVLLVASILSNLVGNASLAEVLAEGVLVAGYLAALLYGSGNVLFGVWSVLLHSRPLRFLRGVQRHERLLLRRGATLIQVAMVALWAWLTLGVLRLRDSLVDGVVGAVTAEIPIGQVELSAGDVLAFVLTVWFSVYLSRFIRFVLDEDVLPRSSLPRGVPYAISSAVHYLILFLGFLLAISAAGFDMSRFALMAGALGVGIGIGLQDVVNNFVSGLILLFERPVQTGDTVEIGALFGEVRRIGMRSSTVRTWSGAEVIVPNSQLVSESVVNWTLSDRTRRIEIPIGVAYGTDPDRVLEILVAVATDHPGVLVEPAPTALFMTHGESSLDFELRAWTARFETHMQVKSELTVAINRALREAGIEIPFPQRDLHIRSADPGVGAELRGGSPS